MKKILMTGIMMIALITVGCAAGQVMDGDGMIRTEQEEISQNEEENMDNKAELSFESFDGGGPEFKVVLEDESIVSYESFRKYNNPDHEEMGGSGYLVKIRFTGLKQGETAMTIEERSPIADNLDHLYKLKVNEDLQVEIETLETKDPYRDDMPPNAFVVLRTGDNCFSVELADNSSADAFLEKLKSEEIEVQMHDYGNFEKVGDLPWDLPTNDEEITTEPGDLILYQGNKITVYYDENTWNFTRLGRLNAEPEEIKEAFGGKDDITAEFFCLTHYDLVTLTSYSV